MIVVLPPSEPRARKERLPEIVPLTLSTPLLTMVLPVVVMLALIVTLPRSLFQTSPFPPIEPVPEIVKSWSTGAIRYVAAGLTSVLRAIALVLAPEISKTTLLPSA